MTLKLDIGAGDYPHKDFGGGEGWTTVDLYKPADVKADMRHLPYKDGEVDEIFCSHALEHVGPAEEARKALAEFRRVLKSDGKLTVVIPDLEYAAKSWLADPKNEIALYTIYGMHKGDGEAHRTGWNEVTLRRDLHNAGFLVHNVRSVDSHSTQSIVAECTRPEQLPSEDDKVKALYSKVADDSVLVACPTYKGKHYALGAYISAYNNFIYPHRHLYMVDNTGTGTEYQRHLKSCGVDADYIPPGRDFHDTFTRSWKKIAMRARRGGFKWVMSIEADNICPPITIDMMLNVARFCRALHVAHSYTWHKTQAEQGRLIGLGCNLISAEMLWDIFQQKQWFTNAMESEIYEYPKLLGFPTVELHNQIDVKHLDDEVGAEQYIFSRDQIPRMGNMMATELKPPKYAKGA